MRPRIAFIALAVLVSAAASGQSLVCPPSGGSAACEVFHYHGQFYRPDSKTFVELTGINQFASTSSCESSRDAALKKNAAVVAHFKAAGSAQYPADRLGPCHCDATLDKTSAAFLTDEQRFLQLRMGEEIRQRVRERLLDSGLTSDSELVRSLMPAPLATAALSDPRLAAPAAPAPATSNPPADIRITHAADPPPSTGAALDLPLAGSEPGSSPSSAAPAPVSAEPAPAPAPATTTTTSGPGGIVIVKSGSGSTLISNVDAPPSPPSPSTTEAPASTVSGPAKSSSEPVTTTVVTADPPVVPAAATPAEDATPVEDAADSFIPYERQRIQKVLEASTALTDENTRSRIFEACMQRIQLLSTLQSLIQGSGAHSNLSNAARAARSEKERLELVSRLFGSDMPPHWAPKDASDVLLEVRPELQGDTEKVLRDPAATMAMKKRALYLVLARTQPTEEQQRWLGTVADSFLR